MQDKDSTVIQNTRSEVFLLHEVVEESNEGRAVEIIAESSRAVSIISQPF